MPKAKRTTRKTKARPSTKVTPSTKATTLAGVTIPFRVVDADCKTATAGVDPAKAALARKAAEYMQHWPMRILIDAVAMFAEQAGQAQCGFRIPDPATLGFGPKAKK